MPCNYFDETILGNHHYLFRGASLFQYGGGGNPRSRRVFWKSFSKGANNYGRGQFIGRFFGLNCVQTGCVNL